jgi:hypothetical protein
MNQRVSKFVIADGMSAPVPGLRLSALPIILFAKENPWAQINGNVRCGWIRANFAESLIP